jgi:hypothetical protein
MPIKMAEQIGRRLVASAFAILARPVKDILVLCDLYAARNLGLQLAGWAAAKLPPLFAGICFVGRIGPMDHNHDGLVASLWIRRVGGGLHADRIHWFTSSLLPVASAQEGGGPTAAGNTVQLKANLLASIRIPPHAGQSQSSPDAIASRPGIDADLVSLAKP